jgi:hypothetical protein
MGDPDLRIRLDPFEKQGQQARTQVTRGQSEIMQGVREGRLDDQVAQIGNLIDRRDQGSE